MDCEVQTGPEEVQKDQVIFPLPCRTDRSRVEVYSKSASSISKSSRGSSINANNVMQFLGRIKQKQSKEFIRPKLKLKANLKMEHRRLISFSYF